MEYTTGLDEENRICTITVTGVFQRPQDSIFMLKFIFGFCRENNYQKFFIDMRNAKILSTKKEDFLAVSINLEFAEEIKQSKMAFLYADDLQDHRFMEYMAMRRGYNVCIFNNYDKAINWLIMDLPSDSTN